VIGNDSNGWPCRKYIFAARGSGKESINVTREH
jgi:hypothetical protein